MGQIPNIYGFLEFLDFLRGYPAAYLLLITASIIFVVRDWRWSLLALLIQYLIAGLLFADVLAPSLAFIKVLVGIFICLMLYVSAMQVNWGRLPPDVTPEEAMELHQERMVRLGPYMLSTDTPFRIFFALMIVLAVWVLSQRPALHLPVVPNHMNIAVYGLIGLGLVNLSITTEPIKAGMGLLTFLTGFELFYSALEQSVAMIALLAVAELAIVLAIAYLSQARHAYPALLD